MSVRKDRIKRSLAISLMVCMCLANSSFSAAADSFDITQREKSVQVEQAAEERNIEEYQVIGIHSEEEYLQFVKDCRAGMDTTKVCVQLGRDIHLEGHGADGMIASFSGWFDGNGHTISGLQISGGSGAMGLFGYIEEGALVENLYVEIEIEADDANNYVGGIAGVNAGTIAHSSASGRMITVGACGGIAGINGPTGRIEDCIGNCTISSLKSVGGMIGINRGEVENCTNTGSINAESDWLYFDDETTFSLTKEGILKRFVSYAESGCDIGGIAGYSDGVILDSINTGVIGYAHSGKNAGGIVGRMSGWISGCRNEGKVFGKRNVGGIVGQLEPTLIGDGENAIGDAVDNLDYLSQKLTADVTKVSNTISNEVSNIQDTITEGIQDGVTDRIDTENASEWASDFDQADVEKVKEDMSSAIDRLTSTDKSYEDLKKEAGDSISADVEKGKDALDQYGFDADTYRMIQDKILNTSESIEQSYKQVHAASTTVTRDIDAINNQVSALKNIARDKKDNLKKLKEGEPLIEDYSALIPEDERASRVSDCFNAGTVNGDRNVGGIAGSIAIEGMDTEDESLEEYNDTYMTLAVLENSENTGILVVKKENGGGIAGYGDLGFIRNCTDRGWITGQDANYLGGIAGTFKGTIHACDALTVIDGNNYIGGVAGLARRVNCCTSMAQVLSTGEWIGTVLGDIYSEWNEEDVTILHRDMKDSIFDNRYVKDGLHGIAGADYHGVTEAITYEELMKNPDCNPAFTELFVRFYNEEYDWIDTREVAYQDSLRDLEYPEMDIDTQEYATWEGFYSDVVTGNVFLVCSTTDNIRTLASESVTASGKPKAFISGVFSELSVFAFRETTEAYTPIADSTVTSHMYQASISNARTAEGTDYKLRIYNERPEENTVVYVLEGSEWKQIGTKIVGSYLEISFPDPEVTVCIQNTGNKPVNYWYYAAGVLAAAAILVMAGKKKRRSRN